jgi:hypothetical protein
MIKILEENKYIEVIFKNWINSISDFSIEIQYKKSLLGFASVLIVNPSEQNTIILNNVTEIMKQIIRLSEEIHKRHTPAERNNNLDHLNVNKI